jgi:hypothetical protein
MGAAAPVQGLLLGGLNIIPTQHILPRTQISKSTTALFRT